MSRLNRIQNEIKQLEGGRFQKLCDVYLYRKRSLKNIVSLGSMEGTDKTTKGIPDTYFFDNQSNKYILVMYGTRKDSTAKLEVDIKEAIEKTKIDRKDIQEIICCHTSSNLTIEKDKELRVLAGSIELTLIGIDTLSHDLLQFKYQDIVKDSLGIAESTEQLWNIDRFISIHDKSKTNATLNTTYIDETNLVEELIESLTSHQVLLLSGIPGTGKTRLAIEVCKKLPKSSNIICVKSNNLPAYQDIKDALDSNRVNYLFLDDANTISNFDAIVNLLRLEEYEQRLKIIITIREYALSGIIDQLQSYKTKIHKVALMSDDQLELLVNNIINLSSSNLKRIMKLSHNNPRSAVIAAMMMKENNHEFLGNEKNILDSYYNQIIKENTLSQNEKVCLFILGFKQKLNLTNLATLEDLLNFFKLNSDSFLIALNQLHGKELCDIFQDKAAKVSDQSLSDFVIIDFIANNRFIKLRDFFISLFPKHAKEIVEMLILVTNFKSSNDWEDYLTNEIKYVYKEVIEDKDKERFLTQYSVLIPIETLDYVYKTIKCADTIKNTLSQKEFEKKKNNRIEDPIIEILCSLTNSEKFKDAGLLLIEYLKKREDKVLEIFSAITLNFDIENTWNNYLEKKFCIIDIFLKQDNISEILALLITNIAEDFLRFSGEKYTYNSKNIQITNYTLVDDDYLMEFHKKIFEVLFKVYKLGYLETNNYIDKLLFNYPVYEVKNGFLETVSSDLSCIKNLFFNDLSKLNFRQEAIVFKLNSEAKNLRLEPQPFFEYEPSCKQNIYKVFSSNEISYKTENFDYDSLRNLRIKNLQNMFYKYENNLLWLFNTLADIQSDELLNNRELEESILLLYSDLDIEHKAKILINLLNSNFKTNYHFDYYMEKLPFVEGRKVLNCVKKDIDERWLLSNFLTCKEINNDRVEELAMFLKSLRDYKKINSFNILSFENYIKQDITILNFLYSMYENGIISGSFFIPNYVSEDRSIRIFNILGYKELERIYLDSLNNENIDDSGEVFKSLLKEQDANFIYLFLIKLDAIKLNFKFDEFDIQLKHIWSASFAEEGIRKYLDYLIQEDRVIFVEVNTYLEAILKADIERSTEFIKTEILNTTDENRLVNLCNLSLEIFDEDILLSLFELIKNKDIGDDFFGKLHLIKLSRSWSGSLVPLLDKDIHFLNKLLDTFEGIDYISHALVITAKKDALKKEKDKALLSDYLEELI